MASPLRTVNVTPTADESAAILTRHLRRQEPFSFFRFGDGAVKCMGGDRGVTRDDEPYSPILGLAIKGAWESLMGAGALVYIGDWNSASFDETSESFRDAQRYAEFFQIEKCQRAMLLHFEALLLMRKSTELADFYRAVFSDPRRKLFMGPAENYGATALLGSEFLETPMPGTGPYDQRGFYGQSARIYQVLWERNWDVLLFGAGMIGTVLAALCQERFPDRTYISLGSAMDPLFRGQSRSQQLSKAEARAMLGRDDIFPRRQIRGRRFPAR